MKQRIPFPSVIMLFSLICILSSNTLAQERKGIHGPNVSEGKDENENRVKRLEHEVARLMDPETRRVPTNIRANELQFASRILPRNIAAKAEKGVSPLQHEVKWVNRGPANIGGRTRALGIDINNEEIILAGGTSGGMWRSVDRGYTWVRTTPLTDMPSATCLVQDTRHGKTKTWYYGTGELGGNTAAFPLWLNYGPSSWGDYYGNGIFKSTDGGITWNVLPSTTTDSIGALVQPFNFVNSLAIDPSNVSQDIIYAAVAGGIERSSDGGATWNMVLGDLETGSGFTDVTVTSKGIVYALLGAYSLIDGSFGISDIGGLYRSTDGIQWTNITPKEWQNESYYVSVAVAPSNENVVYVAFDSASSKNVLWKYTYLSGDGSGSGGIFEDRSANLTQSEVSFVSYVKVKPDDENTVFVGGLNLIRSNDGFETTDNTVNVSYYNGNYNLHVDQNSMSFSPSNPSVMVIGNDGGVFFTEDNLATDVEWTSLDNSYLTAQFYTAAIDHATPGDMTIIGGMQDNSTFFTSSEDAADPWVFLLGGDGSTCAIADGRSSYIVSLQNGMTYLEILDDQGNYLDYTRIDPSGGSGYPFYNTFCLDPTNTDRIYFGGGNVLWRNNKLSEIPLGSDNTTNVGWTRLTNTSVAAIGPIVYRSEISAVAASRTPANRVYYGTNDGQVFRLDSANVGSPKKKAIWKSNGFPSSAYVSSIGIDPANADNVFIAFANYNVQSLFYTSDGGSTWTPIGGNLEEYVDGKGNGPSCRSVAILHSGNGVIYLVGTSTGLYTTSALNGMSTVWTLEGANSIGNNIVNMIDTRESDGMVVVATCGNGMFSGQFEPKSSVGQSSSSLQEIQLFPNPTSGVLTMQNVPKNTSEVTIVNVLGETVMKIEKLSATSLSLDLSKFVRGTYYIRFTIADTIVTKIVVLE
jgi:hypothetical protein